MKRTLFTTAVVAAMASGAQAQDWDMALAYPASNYHSETAQQFAKAVAEATDGALTITTHPNGSLFGGSEIYGAVRRGLVPIGERLISALANEDPFFEIDSLPFVATDFKSSRALYEASKDTLTDKLDEAGLHFLYSCPWPPQSLYSAREVSETSDLKGMKFRAYNAVTSSIAENLGMVPVKIEAADVPQAFATGVADSMISSGSTGYDSKLWENVPYFYDVRAWLPRNMVIVNQRAWDRLDESVQSAVTQAAADAENSCWTKAEELTGWYLEQFEENGMTVANLPEPVLEDFRAAGETLVEQWKESADESSQQVLEDFRASN